MTLTHGAIIRRLVPTLRHNGPGDRYTPRPFVRLAIWRGCELDFSFLSRWLEPQRA